ncbi:MAG TPA: D-2-hydroxyacid dehydrogenase [Polyangiaceae bacterium]
MRIVVLDGFSVDQGELGWEEVEKLGELTVYPRTHPPEVRERAAGADALLTNKVPLTGRDIEALPALRYIGVLATGTNVVDFEACRPRGIAITNVPGYCASAVAQFVIALLLHFIEDLPTYFERVKKNGWAEAPDWCWFLRRRVELSEKTMAVLGLGSIGGKVAEIAGALGMNVLAAAVPGGTQAGRVPLATALEKADVVSLHCPLTEETRSMVDRRFLGAMKPGAILINTSRGALIDEGALIEALATGRLGGALLDVLTQEPPPRNLPLLDPEAPWAARVIVTPHIAWGTVEARTRLIDVVARNLAAFSRGERLNRVD